jgi:hypothetical protein
MQGFIESFVVLNVSEEIKQFLTSETLNQRVSGSSPERPTNKIKGCTRGRGSRFERDLPREPVRNGGHASATSVSMPIATRYARPMPSTELDALIHPCFSALILSCSAISSAVDLARAWILALPLASP